MNTIGKNILNLRKQNNLTQEELAGKLNVSFQAVSKWENGISCPDVSMLAPLAVALGCSIDSLLGYAAEQKIITDYETRYRSDGYYWGVKPSDMCYEVMKLLPPDRPLRLLDICCGEGKDAVFFARNGYTVTAFDIAQAGLDKAKRLAEQHRVNVNFFRANAVEFRLESEFDVIFCSGALHYLPEEKREEIFDNYRKHTSVGGIHAMNVFVKKPFVPLPPDKESSDVRHYWISGELMSRYTDWKIEYSDEIIFDCNSGGVPHKHCMDRVYARRME